MAYGSEDWVSSAWSAVKPSRPLDVVLNAACKQALRLAPALAIEGVFLQHFLCSCLIEGLHSYSRGSLQLRFAMFGTCTGIPCCNAGSFAPRKLPEPMVYSRPINPKPNPGP